MEAILKGKNYNETSATDLSIILNCNGIIDNSPITGNPHEPKLKTSKGQQPDARREIFNNNNDDDLEDFTKASYTDETEDATNDNITSVALTVQNMVTETALVIRNEEKVTETALVIRNEDNVSKTALFTINEDKASETSLAIQVEMKLTLPWLYQQQKGRYVVIQDASSHQTKER